MTPILYLSCNLIRHSSVSAYKDRISLRFYKHIRKAHLLSLQFFPHFSIIIFYPCIKVPIYFHGIAFQFIYRMIISHIMYLN